MQGVLEGLLRLRLGGTQGLSLLSVQGLRAAHAANSSGGGGCKISGGGGGGGGRREEARGGVILPAPSTNVVVDGSTL